MATRTLASSPSSNSDLTRQGSIYSLTIAELQNTVGDSNKNFGSMSMDELVRNIWTTEENQAMAAPFATLSGAGNLSRQGSVSMPTHVGNKTVEEVWKEISGVCSGAGDERKIYKEPTFGEMTLEDFLTRAGVVRDEEVRVSAEAAVAAAVPGEWGGFPAAEAVILQEQIQQQQQQQIELFGNGNLGLGFGNELVVNVEGQGGQGGQSGQSGRERRRGAQEPVDKVAQQRQRRMIKNRESAARSRERKQAYTVELESLVTQLEEENAELVRQQGACERQEQSPKSNLGRVRGPESTVVRAYEFFKMEHTKKRLKQLIENLIPVDEVKRPRPPRVLRKTRSIHW